MWHSHTIEFWVSRGEKESFKFFFLCFQIFTKKIWKRVAQSNETLNFEHEKKVFFSIFFDLLFFNLLLWPLYGVFPKNFHLKNSKLNRNLFYLKKNDVKNVKCQKKKILCLVVLIKLMLNLNIFDHSTENIQIKHFSHIQGSFLIHFSTIHTKENGKINFLLLHFIVLWYLHHISHVRML